MRKAPITGHPGRRAAVTLLCAALVSCLLVWPAVASAYTNEPVSHDSSIEFLDDIPAQKEGHAGVAPWPTLYWLYGGDTVTLIDIASDYPASRKFTVPAVMQDSVNCQYYTVVGVQTISNDGYGNSHNAFSGNTWITEVDFENQDDFVLIGENSFKNSAVSKITLPASLGTIGRSAFEGSALTSLTIPAGVTSIGDRAFAAPGLTAITFKGAVAPASLGTGGYQAFDGLPASGVVYYPEDANYALVAAAVATATGGSWLVTSSGIAGELPPVIPTGGSITPGTDEDDKPGGGGTSGTQTRLTAQTAKVAAIADRAYTGKAIKPAVKVTLGGKTLKSGTDYTVAYKNNKAIGKATVTITGRDSYKGSVTTAFRIVPAKTPIKSARAGAGKVSLKWTPAKGGITRQQIQYRLKTAKKWKTVTAAAKARTKVIAKLKKGKTYSFRLRSYKTAAGSRYYSPWSAVKSVKIKK
jgi:hypothetical protein